jgi:hypothetical protein
LVGGAILGCLLVGDPNAPSGIEKDIFTYMGATLSLVGAAGVFYSDSVMVHWKLHPYVEPNPYPSKRALTFLSFLGSLARRNPLIYFKMMADSILAVITSAFHPNP